jgi:predicted PurR-regulated permease PerM
MHVHSSRSRAFDDIACTHMKAGGKVAAGVPVRPPPRGEIIYPRKPPSGAESAVIGAIVVAALYFGREVFMPMALAALLSFGLAPVVRLLRRCKLRRGLAVAVAVLLAFLVIVGIGSLLGGQLAQLAVNLPQYQSNIVEKVRSLKGSAGGGNIVERATAMLRSVGNEIAKPEEAAPGTSASPSASRPATASPSPAKSAAPQPPAPLPVEIHQPEPTPIERIETILGPLLQPLGTAGIVIVFVIFVLAQREDLRDRLIRLAGAGDLRRTTEALDDAARRIGRYILAQLAINTTFGVLIGIGLGVIGVPNPVLFGVLGMLLRFVPYIGAFIVAAIAVAMAVAVDPSWSMALWTLCLFLVIEPVTGQVIEPLIYGQSTGLSPIAVLVAAAFWTWLWGPVGLLLSTPLTVCLVVLGRHVEYLQFLDILLGDEPALSAEESFYQCMLAQHPDEAALQAEELLKEMPLSAYYDEVAIQGLALAQRDVNRGALDHEHRARVKETIDGVIDDLSDHDDVPPDAQAESGADKAAKPKRDAAAPPSVMCIGGRGSLDEAAAAMLVQLLEKHGVSAQVAPSSAASFANLPHLDVDGIRIACLSYLEPGGFTNARFLVRRLRRRLPHATIVIGFWTLTAEEAEAQGALAATGADRLVTSLRQAVELVMELAAEPDAAAGDLARAASS